MKEYVIDAYNRLKNQPSPNFNDPLHKFICDCVGLPPSVYGPKIQKKIMDMLKMCPVKNSEERGDMRKGEKFFEFKVSFLSNIGTYTIANIREWHNFDYYICLFIDTEDNFNYKFYILNKEDIKKFSLNCQNGTCKSNEKNVNVGMRTSIVKDGVNMDLMNTLNLLSNDTFDSCLDYISNFNKKKSRPIRYNLKLTVSHNDNFLRSETFLFSDSVFTKNYQNLCKWYNEAFGGKNFLGEKWTSFDNIMESSFGSMIQKRRKDLSMCSKRSKSYFKVGEFYISKYSGTNLKLLHLKKLESYHNSLNSIWNIKIESIKNI